MSGLPRHSGSGRASAPRREPIPFALSRRDRAVAGRRLLSHELFRDALQRERKRADRFEEAFAVVLVSLDDRAPASRWGAIVDCLSQSMSSADLIGWLVTGKVLGVIRGLEGRAPAESPAAHAAALQHDLLRCLTPDRAQHCSIRLEIYSPKSDAIPSVLLDGLVQRPTAKELVRDAAKRVLDIIGSLACLVAFLPLFVAIAVLVKCSSRGSVLFRQQRVGKAGRPFSMLKFRTMHVNADPAIHQAFVERFIQAQEKPDGAQNVVFKIVGDPRVTRFGHFLRRSSLDELPQFWNVLKGEMSLVGPRPPVPYELARYKGWHRRRVLEAKPGVTGLWQVTGRSRTTFDEMVRLDLRYARSHSLWTDLKILLATPRAVLTGRGAH